MKSAGALSSRRPRRLIVAAIAATALALSAGGLASAQSVDESPASAAWKTAAAASATENATVSHDAPIVEIAAPLATSPAPASAARSTNAGPSNLMLTPSDPSGAPNSAELAPAEATLPDQSSASSAGSEPSVDEPNEITSYEQEQSGMPPEQLQSLREYDSGGELSTPIGIELAEDRRTLNSGEEADGLLVVGVKKGSPAAEAGLRAYSNAKHQMITGVAMAGAMFFPPAILLIPALDYAAIGQSYDLIIGIDGTRVRNFLDFQDRMRNLEPGEMIYLSVLRDGKRVQITVRLPAAPPNLTQATK